MVRREIGGPSEMRGRPTAANFASSDRRNRFPDQPMETANMNMKQAIRCATAASLALMLSTAYAAGDDKQPMTGKQKATAIGATTGAVAGAVVGGPVGAVVGGVAGGVIGHQGTDANGRVTNTDAGSYPATASAADGNVRSAQAALQAQGYNPGSIDGHMGPNTRSALMKFQQDKGLTPSGTLDDATQAALGVK
jgi:hypothetical protein